MDVCKHSLNFASVIALDNLLIPNVYELTYSFKVKTVDFDEQNVAFNRIKHFVEERIANSLALSIHNAKYKTLVKMSNNMIVLPCDPMDFPVACAIFKKLEAITEGKFEILTLQLKSMVGDNVEYILTAEDQEEMDMFLADMPTDKVWWTDVSPNTNKSQPYIDWDAVMLSWPDRKAKKGKGAQVARIIQFNPTIVEGGK
jgi:hypothetical protein